MRRVVVWALIVFLVGVSLLLAPAAAAQIAPDDATELTQAEFQNLLLSGQLAPGVYIVDGVYTIFEGVGSFPEDPNFDPFPADPFAGVPDEYRFLVDPAAPLPPEFAFLDDPTLPVPPEWAFLVDARQPVPEEFQWLYGPVPAEPVAPEPSAPAPIVEESPAAAEAEQDDTTVDPADVDDETPVAEEADDGDTTADPADETLVAEEADQDDPTADPAEVVGEAVEPAEAAAAEVAPDPSREADPIDDAPADVAANGLVTMQPGEQQSPRVPDGSSNGFIVPLLIFVAVASTALLAAIPIFLRGRSSNDNALRELALTDDLTKLANRRRLDRDLSKHERLKRPIAVAMIDIDHFKRLNDDFSHAIGDLVLQQVAAAIAMNIRASDIAYRYGGEEFCVLLPDATEHEAAAVVERVRTAIERMIFDEIDRRVTVSAGVAVTSANGTDEHGNVTVRRADAALYAAKNAGRNRVMLGSLVGDGLATS